MSAMLLRPSCVNPFVADTRIIGTLSQYLVLWCTGFLRRQVISNHVMTMHDVWSIVVQTFKLPQLCKYWEMVDNADISFLIPKTNSAWLELVYTWTIVRLALTPQSVAVMNHISGALGSRASAPVPSKCMPGATERQLLQATQGLRKLSVYRRVHGRIFFTCAACRNMKTQYGVIRLNIEMD